jgi:hypothetical protein
MKKLLCKLFGIKEKPVKKYPTIRQLMTLCDREFPGQTLGSAGNGMYRIGNGRLSGRKGWTTFQNGLLKRALNEPNA